MDIDDPAVEELDSFSLLLPLPFRLAILVVLGVWLWGLNLHGLRLLNIVRCQKREHMRLDHADPQALT